MVKASAVFVDKIDISMCRPLPRRLPQQCLRVTYMHAHDEDDAHLYPKSGFALILIALLYS